MTAALTPRVRNLILCDRVLESDNPEAICDLEGVRCLLYADAFPHTPSDLWLFLLLSSARPGTFPGHILVVDGTDDKAIFYGKINPAPTFGPDDLFLPVYMSLPSSFPHPGEYVVQVWFFQENTSDVLKAEQPFYILQEGT